jgi:hypothetical protein
MDYKKLFKILEFLDNQGKFSASDKVENFIKSAAYVDLPNMYPETKTDIPHTLLQGMFENLPQTSMGSQFAGGGQFGMQGAFKSKFGPNKPLVLPTLSPTQMMKMEKDGRYQDLQNIMMIGGMQLEKFSRQGNERLIGLSTLLSQYNSPSVSDKVKQQFFANFPSTVSSLMMQDLSVRPIKEWGSRIQEYSNVLQKNAPKYVSNFNQAISEALKNRAQDIRYKNQNQYANLLKDKDWQALSKKYNVVMPSL